MAEISRKLYVIYPISFSIYIFCLSLIFRLLVCTRL